MDITDRLKRAYSKGLFDEEFVQAAREDLPFVLGRMSMLEEYYRLSRLGADVERQGRLAEQLSLHLNQPLRPRAGLFARLRQAFR